ncbi:MAG TPA: hypothetical protein VFJ19_07285 [Nocardioidaceae bacterium]|nr:hypothetical protein [Nocardioidaceae bacterium]
MPARRTVTGMNGVDITKKRGLEPVPLITVGAVLLFVAGILLAAGPETVFPGIMLSIVGGATFLVGTIAQGIRVGLRDR